MSHNWACSFTKIVGRKKIDVLTCPCGVVGYRPTGTEQEPERAKRFKAKYYENCIRPERPRIVDD